VTPVLHSKRLDLEPLTVAHARLMFEGMCDDEVNRFVPHDAPQSIAALEATFGRRIAGGGSIGQRWYNWTPVVRATGAAIGNVQITVLGDTTARVGYFLLRAWWGQGLAREACTAVIGWVQTDPDIALLIAEIDTRNTRSRALVTTLGFSLMAVHEHAAILKGERSDEARYELPLPRQRG
jgi:RimJ/RimL family protein N-acetyltransferase